MRCRWHTQRTAGRGGKRLTGFTLIELLVVVAIIAVLLAILLPSLQAARHQVKRAACLSNVQQVARAWRAYSDENLGFFPQDININYNYGGWAGTNGLPWPSQGDPPYRKPLNRYLGLDLISTQHHARVYRCPSDGGSEEARPTHYDYYGNSYLTNYMMIGQEQFRIDRKDPVRSVLYKVRAQIKGGVRMSRVTTNHAELLLVGDAGWVNSFDFLPNREPIEWHRERRTHNIGFLDGHAAFTKIRKGIHVDAPNYVVIPFRDLAGEAAACQVEAPGD